ncbi:polysaccharide biosynthesis tyrosine autokinase [Chroococcidiopsis sp. CCNUC1]|uniref:GumC family protein n=1 Tax=Chroococcidiopsis sp. CCNUC1 TaxID=2653189 RepID=UPI002020237F|nr:polysaccharide biosynthesis tyrosine autokinase [Chroococcidiopsis sp. CCNUC1]URD49576.1 polysaccharide biosynthesis tyrosine autokinase [Chroococcidiopsis sp. CCNUC1]
MEEQYRTQHLATERNGKYSQMSLPSYVAHYSELPQAEEWSLSQLLAVVRRRAPIIASVAIACCVTTWVWTLTQPAKYEGKLSVLVEPVKAENKLSGLSNVPVVNASPKGQESLDYSTQIIVLRSPEIIIPIAKNISVRYPDINYASLLEGLKVSRYQETKILEVSYRDSDPQKIQFVLEQLAKGYLKYSLQEQQTNLRQGIQFVNTQLPQLQARVNSLQLQLQRFREQYSLFSPEEKTGQLFEKYSTLEFQKLEIQKDLAEAQKLYNALQSKSGTKLALELEAKARHGVGTSQQQSTVDHPQKSPAIAAIDESSTPSRAISPQAQQDAPQYQSLLAQLQNIDTEIAKNATIYRVDSPYIQSLKQKRESLLPLLHKEGVQALENQRASVLSQLSILQVRAAKNAQALDRLNREIDGMPNLARRYTDLQRELVIATESLNRFLERRESLQIENAQKETPWQLISPPQLPSIPIFPNIPRFLILGTVASILAGIGAALLVERLDNVVHSPDELKEATKLPILGIIPFHKNLAKHLADGETNQRQENSRSRSHRNAYGYHYFPFLESFRSLYTNIGFLGSDTPIHSLVISSSVHADGKSTISTHLAQAAAAMGRRVLLVDADLRLPQIHHILHLSNDTGLSNAITTNVPVADLIQRSPAWENLFVLTAGQIPPDPTKLLSSHKMRNIMEQLRQQYDLVIYDTPPLLGLADASLLAPLTAGIAIVTRMGKTDRALLMQTLDQLKLSRTQVLGAICNGVKDYKATTSYHHYYYQPRTRVAE